MHAAAQNLRGVSPRGIRLRGQGIIEYVLIIAVIGLVIVFAGPGVAGAIRNQFNLVGNTVNNGTVGCVEGGASGGGSAGTDSATVQAAIAKDAKDWTLEEQEAVAEDIAAKDEASPAFAKAKAAIDAETKFSVKLTNGKTLEYRIIGLNHDDLADGSGKAGLTFATANDALGPQRMNATNTTVGGGEKSEIRSKMNSDEIWNLMPVELRSEMRAVTKVSNNVGVTFKPSGGAQPVTTSKTTDRLFLLSYSEIWGGESYVMSWVDGNQYEYFANGGYTNSVFGWIRTPNSPKRFYTAAPVNEDTDVEAASTVGAHAHPAFCF
ncbi:DUF6273 domain-containing protein [Ellagibacter isourolithinifaciens]|uniref:DUF6273 domain-containing protein n=1 Tax=Ellagibacter isourolithinifaciens TaxID=2137581 RepID=UPI003AAD63D2